MAALKIKPLELAVLFLIALMVLINVPSASAHEHRTLTIAKKQVEFVVGWVSEPPYVDELNGIDFRATLVNTGAPVLGLDIALQVEVSTGNQKVTLKLSPVFSDDVPPWLLGYTANMMPTVPGVYVFRFFGNVNGTQVNESFQCGPSTFECVNSLTDIQFPAKTASERQTQTALQSMQTNLQSMQANLQNVESQLRYALYFAYFLGATGVAIGIIALLVFVKSTRRERKPQ